MVDGAWNFGDLFDNVGETLGPDNPALIQGDKILNWPEMTRRSNNLARAMLERGISVGDKMAFYMRNCPEYIEGFAAAAKARLVHVNVNYRYLDDELSYIFQNSDATCALYAAEFRENIVRLRDRLPNVKLWIEVGGNDHRPAFSESYEDMVQEGDGGRLDIERSGDDLMLLYTGGTTGMPKGVMWTHDIWMSSSRDSQRMIYGHVPENLHEHRDFVLEHTRHTRQLPACPLMHGTGLFTAMGAILNGGAVVTLPVSNSFDPHTLWQAVTDNGVTAMAIVGDAFAKPMVQALEEKSSVYDTSSVQTILSSGVMWSTEVKRRMLAHIPQVALMDSFGASEAVGFGMSVMTAAGEIQTSKFEIGKHCKVFTVDGREVAPGSGEAGIIARGGAVPLGYYKDEEKTAQTFKTINGVRYAIPGDWCRVEADGTLTLLGRGSICINSGGEKIYPEEVEEVIKSHEAVNDALVVGLPDEKWGQAVTAVVSLHSAIGEDDLRAFVHDRLARYKAPKRILFKDDLGRAPNGKADYAGIRKFAMRELNIST